MVLYRESYGRIAWLVLLVLRLHWIVCVTLATVQRLWPTDSTRRSNKSILELAENNLVLACPRCSRKKMELEAQLPRRLHTFAKYTLRILIAVIVLKAFLIVYLHKDTMDKDMKEWNPYKIMGLPEGATTVEIRKKYRELSVMYNPNEETEDHEMMIMITKAYEDLTSEESREYWEKYGNPESPEAVVFGISLPSWMSNKHNLLWALAICVLIISGLFVVERLLAMCSSRKCGCWLVYHVIPPETFAHLLQSGLRAARCQQQAPPSLLSREIQMNLLQNGNLNTPIRLYDYNRSLQLQASLNNQTLQTHQQVITPSGYDSHPPQQVELEGERY